MSSIIAGTAALHCRHTFVGGIFTPNGQYNERLSASLVPKPFPPPVFEHILYAKTEGEGLGERVTCVTSGRREGRREGGGV